MPYNVVVLGASGVIGQHMMLSKPDVVNAIYQSRANVFPFSECDLSDFRSVEEFLEDCRPNSIVNLAGESRPDVVEHSPHETKWINEQFPERLAEWCEKNDVRLVQVSTQAVFSGTNPPYYALDDRAPVNEYGRQKMKAEDAVLWYDCSIVVRPTFCLGVRPLPHVGRSNPLEQMLSGQKMQVNDRFFSVAFAGDVARTLWHVAMWNVKDHRIIHCGIPKSVSRYEVARALGCDVTPAASDDFVGIAPRPLDTTYADNAWHKTTFDEVIQQCRRDYYSRANDDEAYRAKQIAMFLQIDDATAREQLAKGFGWNHAKVAEDFRAAAPKTDDDLLEWYVRTDSYIWELTAYHLDQRFNYHGFCDGISARIRGTGMNQILCLGDGIGDLTAHLRARGFNAVYNDLIFSKTAAFAAFRYHANTGETLPQQLSVGWRPVLGGPWDCIISSDFLEHVTDVTDWVRAIHAALRPGGLFMAQNAFACGSGESGSIPMHLARNDRFEKEWDPFLSSIGFTQESSNWYRK